MSRLPIQDLTGATVGNLDIPDELLVLKQGDQAVQEVVVAFRAGQRAGTAATLGKGQVAGSNRKPWQQKGLGRARAGYRQSPVWRGGGVVFGPHPRDYAKQIPRQVARLAFRRILSEKITAGGIRVVKDLALAEPKTRQMLAILKVLQITGRVLLVLEKPDRAVSLAVRNLAQAQVALARDLHPYQVLCAPTILASVAAMAVLEKRLRPEQKLAATP